MSKIPDKYKPILISLVLALCTIVAFAPARRNEFVNFDDGDYVFENPNVRDGISLKSVVWAFTRYHSGNWHPLTWLSHMLDCELFDLNPAGHHITSLLLHTANALLLFYVFRAMTGMLWPSAFVAAAFALHPLHVESVAWVAERKDVLSTLFWLLTMAAYYRYTRSFRIGWYVSTILIFILGLMAKPMLVTLPFVLLLLDYWPLNRLKTSPSKSILEKLPFFVLAAISCLVTFLIQQKVGAVNPLRLRTRIGVGILSYGIYIWKMIWPAKLAVFYPLPGGINRFQFAACAVLLIGVTIAAVFWIRRRPWLLTGWFWYLGTLVPVIGLVKVGASAMADRYTYIPSIGIFIIAAWGASELFDKYKLPKIIPAILAAAILTSLLISTRTQVRYWRNDVTLFGHAISVTEKNFIAHNNLGMALQKQGMINEAVEHYKASVEYCKIFAETRWNLADALLKQGWVDKAISQCKEAVELEKNKTKAYKKFAAVLFDQNRFNEAAVYFAKVADSDPNNADAQSYLAKALMAQDKLKDAEIHFRKALQIRDDYFTNVNLADVLARQGSFDDAVKYYRRAITINPQGIEAANGLKAALEQQNKNSQKNSTKAQIGLN